MTPAHDVAYDLPCYIAVNVSRVESAPVTRDDVETFERCIAVGGVALFPADTVYGLATEPDSREGIARLYRLKGRRPDRPAAVMFFDRDLALEALPELPYRNARGGGAPAARRSHPVIAQ